MGMRLELKESIRYSLSWKSDHLLFFGFIYEIVNFYKLGKQKYLTKVKPEIAYRCYICIHIAQLQIIKKKESAEQSGINILSFVDLGLLL